MEKNVQYSAKDKTSFLQGIASKKLLMANCIMALTYFIVLAFGFKPGNKVLFYLLIAGEVFHLIQIFGFCFTIWEQRFRAKFDPKFAPPVDVFITVCGEP
jgi:cellulose synthase (UDP-forming)